MSLDGVSDRAERVYQAMKMGGWTSLDHLGDAEHITAAAKPLPKPVVLNCLQELEQKGYVRRKAREKAAGYFITRLV